MEEIKTILNAEGQVTIWPAKHAKKALVVEYLAGKFEIGRTYTEPEVNEILSASHTLNDSALLRRELFERKFFDRSPNGEKYWRIN